MTDKINGKINVVIPSYKRAGAMPGAEYFYYARYVVPESQAAEYRAAVGKDRVLICPDAADGNLCRKRNWILRNVTRPVLMIDDDVEALMHSEGGHGNLRLTGEEAEALIVHGFNLAHEWGCRIWGINMNTDPISYQQYKPFSLTHPINGPFNGHLGHDLFYDERIPTKDDYDISLQALNKYRKILRLNKYSYICKHGDNAGGCVSQRTRKHEEDQCRLIMKKWGKRIIYYKIGEEAKRRGDLLSAARFRVPIAGV